MARLPLLLLLLAAPAFAESPEDELEAREHVDHDAALIARGSWWRRQRAWPAAAIPEGAHAAALARYRTLVEASRPSRGRGAFDVTGGWMPIGPSPLLAPPATPNSDPVAGRMSAIALHPTDPATFYVGGAQGGVWRTSDGGATFTPIFDAQPSLAIGAIALDPDAPDTIYVGTGEGTLIGYYGDGLYKSTDAGKTWIRPAGTRFAGASIHRLFVDSKAGTVYLATTAGSSGRGDSCTGYYPDAPDLGLWRSPDGGSTWTRLVDGSVADFEVDVSETPRPIFLTRTHTGAYLLVDGSPLQPLPLPGPMSMPPAFYHELALSPSNPQILYAGVGYGDRHSSLFVSQDHGASFTELPKTPNYCYGQCGYDNVVTVHPTDPATVFLGGGVCSIFGTTNALDPSPTFRALSMPGGFCAANMGNWQDHYVHPDAHALVFAPPSTLYAATDGGIARSPDGGQSWEGLNDTLSTLQFYGLCQDRKDPVLLWGGTQDNGTVGRDHSGWHGLITGDGGPCVANLTFPNDPATHVLTSDIFGTLFADNGAGNDLVFNAYPGFCRNGDPGCGDRVGFIAPVAGDPSSPSTVYVGTHRLWRSTEGGAAGTWSAFSPDLTNGLGGESCAYPGNPDDVLTTIAVAPSDSRTIYTGSAGGAIWKTDDGGAKWTNVSAPPLPFRWVSAIAVDPNDPRTVSAAYSGFSRTTPNLPGHFFHSTDGGATWERRDPALDVPFDSLTANPVNGRVLYAGTDVGVLLTTDAGATWTPLDGLPAVAVYSLLFHEASATLTAGTHGRGVFTRTFVATLTADPPQLALRKPRKTSPEPATLRVGNADRGGSIVRFTATSSAPWLAVTPDTGRAAGADPVPLAATLTPDADQLAPGEYDATLTIADPAALNKSIDVPVHLTVDGGCGCQLGRASGARYLPLALLVLALAFAHRRRLRGK